MPEIDKELGAYYLSVNPERYGQPAVGNFFKLIVEDLDSLLAPGVDEALAEEEDYLTDPAEAISLAIQSVPDFHYQLNVKEIRRGNSVWRYAGVPTFNSGQFKVVDYIGIQSKSVLEAWQNLAYNPITDKAGNPSNYKKNCTVIEYSGDGTKVRSWKIYGCFISGITEDGYDNTTAGDTVRVITADISYDRAIPSISTATVAS